MIQGTVYGAAVQEYQLRLVGEITPDPIVENNKSHVKMWVYLHFPYGTFEAGSRYCDMWIIDADGNRVEYSQYAPAFESREYTSVLIGAWEMDISHRDDGTQAVRLGARFNVNKTRNGQYVGYISVETGDLVLPEIPRASAIVSQTASVIVNGENAWTLKVARKNDKFYNIATLTFGDKEIITESFEDEVSQAVPVSWLENIPTQQKSTVQVAIQTYSGETKIANPVHTAFEIVVPADFGLKVTDAEWVTVNAGNPSEIEDWQEYIFGHSHLEAVFNPNYITTFHGAYVAGVSVILDGVAYNASPQKAGWTVKTGVMSAAGKKSVTVRATDSRGFYHEETVDIEVLPYSRPMLYDISIYRCDADGNADDSGVRLYIAASVKIASCGGRNAYSLQAQISGLGTYALTSGKGENVEGIADNQSYTVTLTANDTLGYNAVYTSRISTAFVTANALIGGNGFAFGGYASLEGVLDVIGWDLKVTGRGEFGGGVDGIMRYAEAKPVPTGKYWIDGEPIYAVAFLFGFSNQESSQTVSADIGERLVGNILSMRGLCVISNHGYQMLPSEYVKISKTEELKFTIESEYGPSNGVLIVEFTYYD